MSIEHNVTSGSAKPVGSASAGHGHGKVAAGQAKGGGGFASLLSSLGADELPPGEALAELLESQELTASPFMEEADLQQEEAGSDISEVGLLLAQSLVPAPAQAVIEDLPAHAMPLDMSKALPATAAAVAEAVPAAPRQTAMIKAAGSQEEASAVPSRVGDAVPSELDAAHPPPDAENAGRPLPVQQRVSHRAHAADLAGQARQDQRVADAAGREAIPLSDRAAQAQAVGQATPGLVQGEAVLRSLERRGEKSGLRLGEPGGFASLAVLDAARVDIPPVAADAGLMTEMRVAEQVSYWVGRGVQNAELQVEGLGEGPVKVSIALQGQEARVEFQADQAQTRQVLQDSVPHLRELLQREGLLLSGVSIGSAGSQASAGRQGQPRQGGRQANVAIPELPAGPVNRSRSAQPLSGRAVDLFV